MTRQWARVLVLAAALLSACDGTTSDLAQATGASQSGDVAVNADTVLDCDPRGEACAKTYWIKADACLRLAQQEVQAGRASSAVARDRTRCATDAFDRAMAGWRTPQSGVGQLQALRLSRQIARTSGDGARANAALIQAADKFGATYPTLNAGPYFAADGVLHTAVLSSDCEGLDAALDLANTATMGNDVPEVPSLRSGIATLQRQGQAARVTQECV